MFHTFRYRSLILIVGFLSLLFSLPCGARAYHYGIADIEHQVSMGKDTCLTYLTPLYERIAKGNKNAAAPIRIRLVNTGERDITRTISFNSDWDADYSYQCVFHLKAGESAQKVVYIPLRQNTINCSIDNNTTHAATLTGTDTADVAYIGIHSVGKNDWSFLSDSAYNAVTTPFNLMEWPADYRVYAALDTLIIDRKEYETTLDEAHRKAIRLWVMRGGKLWLVGEADTAPSSVQSGMGLIAQIPSLTHLPSAEKEQRIQVILNDNAIFPNETAAPGSVPNLKTTQACPDELAHKPFLITTPSALVGMILLPFALIVGPLCLWYWAPVGKRQRLFYLIPAISLIFFALIALCILLDDGTGGRGERTALILVNQEDNTALILQNQICRTGIITGSSFTLPEEALLQGYRIDKTSSRNYYFITGGG